MNIGKNLRTRISTIIAVGAYLNMLLATFDPSVISDNKKAMFVYQLVSAVLAFCAWANSHYYNQDFTVIADAHTKLMREDKELQLYDAEKVEEPEDSYIEESEVIANEV